MHFSLRNFFLFGLPESVERLKQARCGQNSLAVLALFQQVQDACGRPTSQLVVKFEAFFHQRDDARGHKVLLDVRELDHKLNEVHYLPLGFCSVILLESRGHFPRQPLPNAGGISCCS